MRTWQQLTEDATSTGTFAGYVGDGASVPWQTCGYVIPPLGLTMFAYKYHLDSHYPAAFKLHDWLYTPYGSLIGASQAEADSALRNHILAIGGITSTIDAAVVYAAVHWGGAYYFGISGTGFDPATYSAAVLAAAPIKSGANIGIGSVNMPPISGSIKVVTIFQQTTLAGGNQPSIGLAGRNHQAGWTESLWWPGSSVSAVWAALTTGYGSQNYGLLPIRADLMASNATIVGVRLYEGGTGKGNFRAVAYPGLYPSSVSDIPQMALLAYLGLGGTVKAKRLTLRGIPDEMVYGGEFNPSPDYTTRLTNYGNALSQFAALTKDDNAGLPIISISDAGVVQLNGVAPPFAVGSLVTIRQTLNAAGQRVGGTGTVTAVSAPSNQFTMVGFPAGSYTGGNAWQPVSSLKSITAGSLTVSRIVTRKVGRPFEAYRGRSSKRR